MSARGSQPAELRRQLGSPNAKSRDTPCKNVLIYGHCRYENQGCTFNHETKTSKTNTSTNPATITPSHASIVHSNTANSTANNNASLMNAAPPNMAMSSVLASPNSHQKTLKWDTPAFTPSSSSTSPSGLHAVPTAPPAISQNPASTSPLAKKSTFSSQSLYAASFTPRGGNTAPSTPQSDAKKTMAFNPANAKEFMPSNYDLGSGNNESVNQMDSSFSYDVFNMAQVANGIPASTPFNPYVQDHAMAGAGYYPHAGPFMSHAQPLQHHLYANMGPYREDLLPYQKLAHDLFLPEKLREDMLKKLESTLRVIPMTSPQLPEIEDYHSLVALDTSPRSNLSLFGYSTWVYKATSIKDDKTYCLRRLEGFRLTNDAAYKHVLRTSTDWKAVRNSSVVSIHQAFTTRKFGGSSLVVVQDFYPGSKTLEEVCQAASDSRVQGRAHMRPKAVFSENIIWSYIVQLGNALRAIHGAKLAVRCFDLSKILVTDKNRIRLNACGIQDLVQMDERLSVSLQQEDDFIQLGKLILTISLGGTASPNFDGQFDAYFNDLKELGYSMDLRNIILWLLTPASPDIRKSIDDFLPRIVGHAFDTVDSSLHAQDSLTSALYGELENARLVRLLAKLGAVNERLEFDGDPRWSENGQCYALKLYRDYLFHAVDANGKPSLDLGRIIASLNRLDVGTNDMISLTSRDEQTVFYTTYKDLKRLVESSFQTLVKASAGSNSKSR
ncbi:PAB-dependent poly(A)-specific ribonuclease subunit PAN3 [Ceratocystis lukuohia]|uniref:PAN2-PAN3 deadenylation complex subunit PAN3 n=2 Tax=Ceratocystis TaxID=5157 RepID=A0A2C5WZJ5_9PEZI|nr:PAB-dependent poly(A)-specific ribonuclease subunit PAN3 [Ceratocystis fimbriata CBS 114723]